MKGLKQIPSVRQLSFAYSFLQQTREKISDRKLILYSQWARLDPRLGEILVQYMSHFWKQHHPHRTEPAHSASGLAGRFWCFA